MRWRETGMQAAVEDMIEREPGITQAEIARRLGVSPSAISQRRRCRRERNGIPHPRPLRRRRRVVRPVQLSVVESY